TAMGRQTQSVGRSHEGQGSGTLAPAFLLPGKAGGLAVGTGKKGPRSHAPSGARAGKARGSQSAPGQRNAELAAALPGPRRADPATEGQTPFIRERSQRATGPSRENLPRIHSPDHEPNSDPSAAAPRRTG